MKILLTGGAGFIGYHVAQSLLERGDSVVIVDNINPYYDPKLKENRIEKLLNAYPNKASFHKVEIANYDDLKSIFLEHQFDVVCHLAAQAGVRYSLEDPFAYERANVLGTLNILELMRHHMASKKIVFASSSSVYGGNKKVPFSIKDRVDQPISLYAATKRAAELYAHVYYHLFGFSCFGLRFFTVYGPWGRPDMALFKFTKAIVEDKPIDVYNYGKMKRNFTYITDVVTAVVESIDKVEGYKVLNVGNDQTVELLEFIKLIEKHLGKEAQKNLMPLQAGDVPITFADITETKEVLDWYPTINIDEGIGKFIAWYKKYY